MRIKTPNFNWKKYAYGTISLCMIMKNEAKRLSRCLFNIRGLVNEIIIVDTGSTDNSIAIAQQHGCKVLHQEWDDDFSKPRNLSLNHATCDWVLIMDPDEILNTRDHPRIRELTADPKYKAFQLPTRNYGRNPMEPGFRTHNKEYPEGQDYPGYVNSVKTRLFKNGYNLQFKKRFHELLDYDIVEKKIPIMFKDIPFHHWSVEIIQENYAEKQQFYLRLAEKKVKDDPADDQAWWELGVTEAIAGLRTRAAYSMSMSMRRGFTHQKRLFALARCLRMTDRPQEANHTFEKAICMIYPTLTHTDPSSKDFSKIVPTTI